MENLKIGIIGIGNMGSAHAHCIMNGDVENLELIAVCDNDEEKLKAFAEINPQIKTYSDYRGMIKSGELDAVLIATPHPLHSEMAIFAFQNGLNVILEKPADISVSKVEKMNEAAKKSGKVFSIMFNQRTNSLFAKAREIVRGGELGELKRTVWIVTNWYRTQHYYDSGDWRATWVGEGGGVLLNQCPHNLDVWQWICGMPKSIIAHCEIAKYHDIEVEDEAVIMTRFENGATGTFITSTGEFPGTNRLEISGTMGKIVLENGKLKWWKLKEDESTIRFSSKEGFAAIDYDYCEIPQIEGETAHKNILQNFTNAVLKGEELISKGEDGILELSISNAAFLSSWTGEEVALPFDCKKFDELLAERCKNSNFQKKNKTKEFKTAYDKRWQVNW